MKWYRGKWLLGIMPLGLFITVVYGAVYAINMNKEVKADKLAVVLTGLGLWVFYLATSAMTNDSPRWRVEGRLRFAVSCLGTILLFAVLATSECMLVVAAQMAAGDNEYKKRLYLTLYLAHITAIAGLSATFWFSKTYYEVKPGQVVTRKGVILPLGTRYHMIPFFSPRTEIKPDFG